MVTMVITQIPIGVEPLRVLTTLSETPTPILKMSAKYVDTSNLESHIKHRENVLLEVTVIIFKGWEIVQNNGYILHRDERRVDITNAPEEGQNCGFQSTGSFRDLGPFDPVSQWNKEH